MITDTAWIAEYTRRRNIVAASGYRWQVTDAVWKQGRLIMTDEKIDLMGEHELEALARTRRIHHI